MEEQWKEINDYNNYLISNFGRIKSKDRYVNCLNNKTRFIKGKILTTYIDKDGYECIKLSKNSKSKQFKIHRLVCTYFIDNTKNISIDLLDVNHKDGNKLNNNHTNLEWTTRKENIQHAYDNGLSNSDSIIKPVRCITTNEEFNSITEACNKYGNIRAGIIRCCKGKSKSAGKHLITKEKLIWKYIEKRD